MGKKLNAYRSLIGKAKEENHVENVRIGRRIILK
jgi:hypothetical protein